MFVEGTLFMGTDPEGIECSVPCCRFIYGVKPGEALAACMVLSASAVRCIWVKPGEELKR